MAAASRVGSAAVIATPVALAGRDLNACGGVRVSCAPQRILAVKASAEETSGRSDVVKMAGAMLALGLFGGAGSARAGLVEDVRRSCAMSSWGASSSKMTAPLSSRPQRVTPGRVSLRVRAAGEEVGTEEAEKLSDNSVTDSGSSSNGYTASNPFPSGRKWTGYVEKDTAGQTNIYAVEPAVYVADSVLSSGEAGSSTEGTSNTVAVAFGFTAVALASAAAILSTVGNNAPASVTEAVGYNGPPLSYYVSKFSKVPVEAAVTVEGSVAAPDLTEGTSVDEAST